VFAAAFLAGAAAAVGVNRVLDVHLAQRRPQVECEPIFVALRPLPQGSPVTVWDVALKDWPKAMLPSSALRAGDSFEGFVLRHAIREGQPLLAVQLIRSESQPQEAAAVEAFVPAIPVAAATSPTTTTSTGDLWTPAAADTTVAAPAAGLAEVTPRQPVTEPTEPAPTAEPPTAAISAAETKTAEQAPTEAAAAPAAVAAAAPESSAADSAVAEPPLVAAADANPPVAPSPTATAVTTPSQPTPADDTDADEMSEAVATDVASMPSVMKEPAFAGTAAPQPRPVDAGKYLVVPERIALQADTSFTTPRPQPPGPPATARAATAAKSRPSARSTGQVEPRRGTPASSSSSSPSRQQPTATPRGRQQPAASREAGSSSSRRPWTPLSAITSGIEAISSPWGAASSTANRPQGNGAVRR